jgi:lipoate-protein ligase A
MKFIDNKGITDPMLNLAMEEYVLKHIPTDDSYFLFYINKPSIIIGKNQNTLEEINEPYIREKGIKVVRRLSGGGAVYHDEGNLNFSFITADDGNSFHNFKKFTQPIVDALRGLGIDAALSGRNDILVGERKISGNAQFSQKGRMFSHGTLMLDTDIEEVVNALKVNAAKIESKGIKSIRSRVANINEFLTEPLSMADFKQLILEAIFKEQGGVDEYVLQTADWDIIHQISQEKYQQWEWNYGYSPKFNITKSKRFPSGNVDVRLDVHHGLITEVHIYGDFFGLGDIIELEQALLAVQFNRTGIEAALQRLDVRSFLGQISKEEFVDLLVD